MSITLLKNKDSVEIQFTREDKLLVGECAWEVGETYTLELDSSKLDADGVSIRLPSSWQGSRDRSPRGALKHYLEKWSENEGHWVPINAHMLTSITTFGTKQTWEIQSGWGQNRFRLIFRPEQWHWCFELTQAR